MEPSRLSLTIAALLTSTLPNAGFAADTEKQPKDKDIEVIVVNGKQQRNLAEAYHTKGISNADIFSTNTSVEANNLRNEAGALDIGIRGVQGEGRVQIFIDGSLQSTHTNRGYMGTSDRTYIDTDLISHLDLEMGPSSQGSAFGAGAIGGTVQIRTLSAADVVGDGKQFGALVKLKTHNNNHMPDVSSDFHQQQYYEVHEKPGSLDFSGGGVMVATAMQLDKVNALLAFSDKRMGNYFAGKHGYDAFVEQRIGWNGTVIRDLPPVNPEGEVVNTSFESESYLAKLGIDFTNEHSLEISSRLHQQEAGEMLASYWHKQRAGDSKFWSTVDANGKTQWHSEEIPEGVETMPQWKPGTADVQSYNVLYKFSASDNPLWDVQLNLWHTDAELEQYNALGSNLGPNAGQYFHQYDNKRHGVGLFNTSRIQLTDTVPLTLMYGASWQDETLSPFDNWQDIFKRRHAAANKNLKPTSRNGKQTKRSVFANGHLELADLALSLNLNHHDSVNEDFQISNTLEFGPKTDLTLEAVYELFTNTALKAKYSNAYRMPSLYESTVSNEVFSYSPDYPISEENIELFEAGIESVFTKLLGSTDELTLGVNYFHTRINDMIATGFLPSKKPGANPWEQAYTFTNYDKFDLPGIEAELEYDSEWLTTRASYTYYTDVRMCSTLVAEAEGVDTCNETGFSGGLTPLRIPPKKNLVVSVGKKLFDDALELGLTYKGHSAKRHPGGFLSGTGANALQRIPSSYQLDFYADYRFSKNYAVYASLTNLTNRYTVSAGSVVAMPEPGRTLTLGLEVKL
ncbi:TonB-dependent receptor domain-containing protein [Shewanella khirikhana]|uniref:Heme/hemopexin utilization protein C n=1 Tax=Shewanella khirikhana TaxID=1965282 RepID=A0ABM7DQ82_9GAMM|nr:TonB-dependent receptor [Shewanella khirikhana]AZQ11845.1 Heme/hemopexin utilization protein C precursor [Shewanella khirikhana]